MSRRTFTIFTLIHADHYALAINIGDLQVHDFRHAQSGGVRGHQMVRCLRLAIDSKKAVISSRLRTTGSLNGFFGNGKSASLQGRLSVTR
jgi:hypothetical protein